jgi:hypothetical protein
MYAPGSINAYLHHISHANAFLSWKNRGVIVANKQNALWNSSGSPGCMHRNLSARPARTATSADVSLDESLSASPLPLDSDAVSTGMSRSSPYFDSKTDTDSAESLHPQSSAMFTSFSQCLEHDAEIARTDEGMQID